MIKSRGARQWLIDGPAGVGLIAIALLSSIFGLNNMVLSATLNCDRQANQTIQCTLTTAHPTGHKSITIEDVHLAQVLSSKTSGLEISGDQVKHLAWLQTGNDGQAMTPMPLDSKNKPSQQALAEQINQFIASDQTQFRLTQQPTFQDYFRYGFIALLLFSMGFWGSRALIYGLE